MMQSPCPLDDRPLARTHQHNPGTPLMDRHRYFISARRAWLAASVSALAAATGAPPGMAAAGAALVCEDAATGRMLTPLAGSACQNMSFTQRTSPTHAVPQIWACWSGVSTSIGAHHMHAVAERKPASQLFYCLSVCLRA